MAWGCTYNQGAERAIFHDLCTDDAIGEEGPERRGDRASVYGGEYRESGRALFDERTGREKLQGKREEVQNEEETEFDSACEMNAVSMRAPRMSSVPDPRSARAGNGMRKGYRDALLFAAHRQWAVVFAPDWPFRSDDTTLPARIPTGHAETKHPRTPRHASPSPDETPSAHERDEEDSPTAAFRLLVAHIRYTTKMMLRPQAIMLAMLASDPFVPTKPIAHTGLIPTGAVLGSAEGPARIEES